MPADLVSRLQLKPGQQLAVLHPPAGLMEGLAAELASLRVGPGAPGATDAVLFFVALAADVPARAAEAIALVRPGGLLWAVYAKGGAKAGTDLNRDSLWRAMEHTGWRPVRQIAVDERWSALRFRPAHEVGR